MVSPNSNDKGTKSSHYVWKKYLKSFVYDGNKIYVKNIDSGACYSASIDRVGMTNNIYRLDKPISKFEQQAACYTSDGALSDKKDIKLLNEIIGFLNNDPSPFMLKYPERVRDLVKLVIKSKVSPEVLARNQEELFTFYEHNFIPIYHNLLNKDCSFFNSLYDNKGIMVKGYCAAQYFKTSNFLHLKFFDLLARICEDKYKKTILQMKKEIKESFALLDVNLNKQFIFHDERYFNAQYFLIFLLTQYFRTEKRIVEISSARNLIVERYPDIEFDLKSFAVLLIHFKMFYTGLGLIRDNYKIKFLINNSNVVFLTSDQPIINTFASEKTIKKLQDHEFELFYPLTPRLAMSFYNYSDCSDVIVSDDEVLRYNALIESGARKYVYSNEKFR